MAYYSTPSHANFATVEVRRSPPWGRPAPLISMAFYDEVMIVDARPVPPVPSPYSAGHAPPRRRPARLFPVFYEGEVVIIDARPVSSAAAPATEVHNLSEKEITIFLETSIYEEEKAAAGGGGGDREVCAVCQDNYREKQSVGVLRCRHHFHAECIGKWLEIKNVCPLCNAVAL